MARNKAEGRPGYLVIATIALMVSACDRGKDAVQDGPANGTATVAKYYEGPRPEGVSSTHDAITRTFYIPNAAIGDMYEIESSRMALARGKSPQVRAFAQRMIQDHERTSADLRRFVADNPVNIAIPKIMDARRQAMITNLKDASDQEFDGVYVGQQAAAHQEAGNLHGSYANRGDDGKLKRLAAQTARLIDQHHALVRTLEAGTSGP